MKQICLSQDSLELEPFFENFQLFGDPSAFGFGHDEFGGSATESSFLHVNTTGLFDDFINVDDWFGVFRWKGFGLIGLDKAGHFCFEEDE